MKTTLNISWFYNMCSNVCMKWKNKCTGRKVLGPKQQAGSCRWQDLGQQLGVMWCYVFFLAGSFTCISAHAIKNLAHILPANL